MADTISEDASGAAGLLDRYQLQPGAYDEMSPTDRALRPHWDYLIQSVQSMGSADMQHRAFEARRLLRESGVTYNVYGDPEGSERLWELDPIPLLITSREWQSIEFGLIQRAELLDLILADVYGPQKLVRGGIIPPELIYGHSGFLLPCHGVDEFGGRPLQFYAADLIRAPSGELRISGDRAQAPSGAGYALENRIVMSRILPSLYRDSQVHRLAPFFRSMRSTLASLARHNTDNPRVIILTPGPGNETYFEHSYLANYLGYTLAQGNDLTVRDGRVWLKTLDGMQPVDVILRRLDGDFCDPLELRKESLLGTPGLLQAVRMGGVVVSNPLGSGVLENPGLMAFLPMLSHHLLGQELRIPSLETFWCGNPHERRHVVANLERLVIKPIFPVSGMREWVGAHLSRSERADLAARIRARPHFFVGQAPVTHSTTPALVSGRLAPRPMVLRTFLVARGDSYAVMPGGLTRVSPHQHEILISNQRGGISKDTWVLASEQESQVSLMAPKQRPAVIALTRSGGEIPSRVADSLFWLGRYAERTEAGARLVREVLTRLLDSQATQHDALSVLLPAVTHVTATYPGFMIDDPDPLIAEPAPELLAVMLDSQRVGSLRFNIHSMTQCGWAVRDRLSDDTWRVIAKLDDDLAPAGAMQSLHPDEALEGLERLILSLAAFAGLSSESMSRGQGYHFVDIGRRIERALEIIALMRGTLVWVDEYRPSVWEALLAISDSRMTYGRRYRFGAQPGPVLDLLLQDESNPRSVGYQLVCLRALVAVLPGKSNSPQHVFAKSLVVDGLAALRMADLDSLANLPQDAEMRESLDRLLRKLAQILSTLSESLSQMYFTHTEMPQQLVEIQ